MIREEKVRVNLTMRVALICKNLDIIGTESILRGRLWPMTQQVGESRERGVVDISQIQQRIL